MKNYWVSGRDIYGLWEAHFPNRISRDEENIMHFLGLVKQTLLFTEQFEILKISKLHPSGAQSIMEYLPFLQADILAGHGFLLSDMDTWPSVISTRLASYTLSGQIAEDAVSDVGELLRRLRPEMVGEVVYDRHYMVSQRAVSILGGISDYHGTSLHISINTDIWFPWVVGNMEEDREPDSWYDNRELAQRHTPRLNAFLAAFKAHTLTLGGQFEFDLEREEYAPMVDADGIRLDWTPDNRKDA